MNIGFIIFLLLLGDILILVEVILIPGTFITGILGLAAIVAACVQSYNIISPMGAVWIFIANAVILTLLTYVILRSKTWKKLSLETKIDSRSDDSPQEKGLYLGMEGVSSTRLAPMGKATFGDKVVEVSTEGEFINPQEKIVITRIEDNKIFVKQYFNINSYGNN